MVEYFHLDDYVKVVAAELMELNHNPSRNQEAVLKDLFARMRYYVGQTVTLKCLIEEMSAHGRQDGAYPVTPNLWFGHILSSRILSTHYSKPSSGHKVPRVSRVSVLLADPNQLQLGISVIEGNNAVYRMPYARFRFERTAG